MVKKKPTWHTTHQGITALCVAILAISGILYKSAKIILIPERVEANEEDIVDIQKIINYYYQNDQQNTNQQRYYQPQIQHQQQRYEQRY